MIEFLFLDLDDTILDFQKAERLALAKTLESFGLPPTDTVLARYHEINREHWERLERKELTRQQVLVGRFAALFAEMGLSAQAEQVARAYEENLSQGHYFLPGAEEALQSLSKKYKLYLASNGTARVQAGRLKSAGIIPYFQEIFVSEEMGYNKPDPAYFDACFARIPGFRKDRAMMVGDSLTSDILGGIQAGISTCWVNPHHKTGEIHPDYEIESIVQLEALLKNL